MRTLIFILFISIVVTCKGQNLNLVPIDSANYELIADTLLYDTYSVWQESDSILFDPEWYMGCPCANDSLNGIVSYWSSSIFISSNNCLFIYEFDSEYLISIGEVTDIDNESGTFSWRYKTQPIKEKYVVPYIDKMRDELLKAEVPRYEDFVIVDDGVSHTFGDIENDLFATTPRAYHSTSVASLIKLSNKLIRRYRR
jgi:hypothetical protein